MTTNVFGEDQTDDAEHNKKPCQIKKKRIKQWIKYLEPETETRPRQRINSFLGGTCKIGEMQL